MFQPRSAAIICCLLLVGVARARDQQCPQSGGHVPGTQPAPASARRPPSSPSPATYSPTNPPISPSPKTKTPSPPYPKTKTPSPPSPTLNSTSKYPSKKQPKQAMVDAIVFENDKRVVTCPSGTFESVAIALYGRQIQTGAAPQTDPAFNCSSAKAVDVVSRACVGKSSCELEATNKLFGDPCKNVYKTLSVRLQCGNSRPRLNQSSTPPTKAGGFSMGFVVDEYHQREISCKNGIFTQVEWAGYGKQTEVGKDTYKVDPKYNCNSAKSLQVVSQACLNKKSCTLAANNQMFGDPCFNIIKTLSVRIRCTPNMGSM